MFVKDAQGNLTKHDTCFTFPTVGEQLTDIGVDWTFYSAVPGQPGYFWNAYNGIANVFHNDSMWEQHVRPVDDIVKDIDAGTLPAVTLGHAPVRAVRPSAAVQRARAQLGHRHRERGDALGPMGAHGHLPDVG